MGNCVRKGSSLEWGGEDWGSFGASSPGSIHQAGGSSLAAATEVKIKISKKELEKLLKEADVEGLSAQQVLAHFINAGDDHQRSWRPALQSIPE